MTKQRWIDEGLRVLSDEGIAGVRIDRLAPRVGLSKGSFFHHFGSAAAFRSAILEEWRRHAVALDETTSGIDLVELAGRIDEVLDVRLERAIRAWASHDDEAAGVVEEVDRARLSALETWWRGNVGDPRRAKIAALVPHLVLIGATVSRPTIDEADVRDAFALLSALIPAASVRPSE